MILSTLWIPGATANFNNNQKETRGLAYTGNPRNIISLYVMVPINAGVDFYAYRLPPTRFYASYYFTYANVIW